MLIYWHMIFFTCSKMKPLCSLSLQDLESILKTYDKGLIVLQEYKINKKLSFMNRNYLAELIIGYELRDNLDKR